MDQQVPFQRRQGERRHLWDRRSPSDRRASTDRRQGDRRRAAGAVSRERRAGHDRRSGDRRAHAERRALAFRRHGRRRRQTPTPYSAEQMSVLRARFTAPGIVMCPACGGRFSLGVARLRGIESARRVSCMGCGRAAVVANTRALRVLVVHEQDAARDVLRSILDGVGHEVIETADAAVALAAYQASPADTVLLSATSTGRMAAPEFLRRLRRDFPDACVVAIAPRPSFAGRDPLAISAGLGATRTIRLPIAPEELIRVVDETRR